MFWKNKSIKKQARNIDKIITTVIIWSAVAWAFWFSKTKKWKQVKWSILKAITPIFTKTSKLGIYFLWKSMSKFVWLFSKKK